MIVITGGAGFIGSSLVAELNLQGVEDILIVDNLGNDEKWKNLRTLRFSDYCDKNDFLEHIDKGSFDGLNIDSVYHLGACSSTTEMNVSYLLKNNYEYSKAVAIWAKSISARFVYASSAATYGDGENGFDDIEGHELTKLKPLNAYGYSKQVFDIWMQKKGLLSSCVGLKYFNVFGPNEYHKKDMRSFVLKAFEQINKTGELKLFKSHRSDYCDGEQKRDFIYVKDAVKMTVFCMHNKKCKGLINIATGYARSWNDLATATFNALGKQVDIQYVDMPESIRNQYQYYTRGNIGKLFNYGWQGKIMSLEEAVEDYVKNYLLNGSYLGEKHSKNEEALHFANA